MDCRVCGDDLRACSSPKCTWSECPGLYAPGRCIETAGKELDDIAARHPDSKLRAVGQELVALRNSSNDKVSGQSGREGASDSQ